MHEYKEYWVTATYSEAGETYEEHVGKLELRKIFIASGYAKLIGDRWC